MLTTSFQHQRKTYRIATFLLISLLLLNSILLFSQEENNDAVYLKLKKEYTLNPDGSQDYRYHKELKLQSYRSFHNLYGETFIVYHPGFQSLKINDASTVMADGRKVVGPSNAFNEVLPAFCAGAPAYNALREMVVTHTGTERNAIVSLDYTIHSKVGFAPALMGNELLSEYEPVHELVVVVRIPSNMKLNYRTIQRDITPDITEEGAFRVYTWKLNNVAAISPEEFQPGGYELYPRLVFSTAPDRDNVYAFFMKQPAFSYGINSEMKKTVDGIRSESSESIDVALKIQEKVINEFRLWPVPLKNTGFTCRPAAETWKSNGGTQIEKAVLLVALLKEAGIEAEPVLAVKTTFFDDKIGSLLDVEDILVRVNLRENGPVYFSVTTLNPQTMSFSLPARTLVSLKPNGKYFLEKTEERKSSLSLHGNFIISEKKQLSGDVSATFMQACDPWFLMLRDQNKMKNFLSGGIVPSDLKEQKIITIGPVEAYVRYSFQKDKPFRNDSNFYFYSIPCLTNGTDAWGIKLLPQKREASLEIPYPLEEKYEFNLILPPGLQLFSAPRMVEMENAMGSFSFEIKKSEDKIRVTKTIRFAKRIIAPSEYADFKRLMDNWNNPRTREIVFTGEQ
jgi:hypothetical protein